MVALILMLIFAAAAAVMAGTASMLRRRHAGRWWWAAFVGVAVIGVITGCMLSFWERQDSPTRRLIGWPFPAAVFKLEEGQWIDYVTPIPAALLIMAVNAIVIASGMLLPLLVFAWAVAGERRRNGQEAA